MKILKFLLPLAFFVISFIAYQNCSKVQFQSEKNVDSKTLDIPTCPTGKATQCLIDHGYGIACLAPDKTPGTCNPLLCDPGFHLDKAGKCVPSSCAPASTGENACSTQTEVGYGSCGSNGQGVLENSCVPLFCRKTRQEASSGTCPSDSCVQGSPCTERNGTGLNNCSATPTTCVLNHCDPGFLFQNGHCVAQTCQSGETMNCTTEWGAGTRKCQNGNFDVICEPQNCPDLFEIKTADHGYKICSPVLCTNGRDSRGNCLAPSTTTTLSQATTTTLSRTTTTLSSSTTTTLSTTTTTLQSPQPFSCLQYQQISFPANVPARDPATGLCYYQKILSVIPKSSSGGTRMSSVLARSHDSATYGQTLSPYILGQASPQFKLLGARNLKLSGSIQQLASIRVDNFLVIKINNQTRGQITTQAYGTADSAITGTNYIKVNSQPVTLTSFGSQGTSTIGALLVNQTFTPNENYTIQVDALDCGSAKELSDVYLVFE